MKSQNTDPGFFETSVDIGSQATNCHSYYDRDADLYRLNGNTEKGSVHFLYRHLKSDFILYTNVSFPGNKIKLNQRAGISVRSGLQPGDPFVSLVYHTNGEVVMECRLERESEVQTIKTQMKGLEILQIARHADTISVMAAVKGTPLDSISKLQADFVSGNELFLGLFIDSETDEALFTNTRLVIPAKDDFIPYTDYIGARLEIIDIESCLGKIIFESDLPIEAPNWSRDGNYFLVNARGNLYKIPANGGQASLLNTGFANSNNNDHGISPDGTRLVISHHAQDRPHGDNSVIYILPSEGGIPEQVTQNSPSYWHGWSPDGKYLIYTAKRNNRWNIYRILASGGEEIPLTHANALDDGSEYSQDGKYIWFNSNRSGSMEIWRMNADGTDPVQITHDNYQNWFAHESPGGNKLVFLTYLNDVNLWDHPYYKHVMLRTIEIKDGLPVSQPRVIAHLYGGQGTINVHSWSPDGKHLAFVSNSQLLKK